MTAALLAVLLAVPSGPAHAETPTIEPGDQLIIVIPDPKPRELTVQVDLDGDVQLGIYGDVSVRGRTPIEAQVAIQKALQKYLRNTAGVTVVLAEQKRLVMVSGKVQTPGMVRVSPKADLWQAIQAAGGVADGADLSRVVLGRRGSEETINLRAFLTRERAEPLPFVEPGDVIFVPSEAVVPSEQGAAQGAYLSDAVLRDKVFVLGEVKKPSLLDRSPGLTPLTAIAMAGGPTPQSDLAGVRLVTAKESTVVDLRAHMMDPTIPLPEFPKGRGAILFVPDRGDPLGQTAMVIGQVETPGRVPLAGPMTLVEAIALAGGPGKDGELDDVQMVRSGPGFSLVTEYDLEDYVEKGNIIAQVEVEAGDTVFVDDATMTGWQLTLQFISDVAIIAASTAFFASIID